MVTQSTEMRKPPLTVRVAAWALSGHLMPRRLATLVLTEVPSRKPTDDWAVDAVYGSVSGYTGPLHLYTLGIAKRSYGKYSSSRAKELLLSGQVKCFHSIVVLASRLSDPADANAVLASGKITDNDVLDVIRYNLAHPAGIWQRLGLEW